MLRIFQPLAATTSVEEAEQLFQKELVDSRILNVKGKKNFGVEMNGVALGNSALSFVRHLPDYDIDCGDVDTEGDVILSIGLNRPSFSSINGRRFAVNEDAAVITSRSTIKHQRVEDSHEVILRFAAGDVANRLQAALNRPISDEIVFASSVPLDQGIGAHAGLPITIADILSQAGCSRKVLFADFRKFRGYTPGGFLATVRLRMAHDRLNNPAESDTVTSIAYESGFSHMGRFSKVYQKRYGVRASETLKRA